MQSIDDPRQTPASEPAQEKRIAPKPMRLDERGLVKAEDHEQVWRMVTSWVKSKILPKQFQPSLGNNNPRYNVTEAEAVSRTYLAHQTLVSVNANVLPNLRFCAYIENAVAFFGDLPLTLVKQSRLLQGTVVEYWLDHDHKQISEANGNLDAQPFAAVCKLQRRGEDVVVRTFTLAEARQAGRYLYDERGKPLPGHDSRDMEKFLRSPWHKHTKRMLQMRARGWAIKDVFPDVLQGVPQLEYDFDQAEAPSPQILTQAEAERHGISRRSSLNDVY